MYVEIGSLNAADSIDSKNLILSEGKNERSYFHNPWLRGNNLVWTYQDSPLSGFPSEKKCRKTREEAGEQTVEDT